MADNIKGINVVIGADTTALSKALGDVNKKSRDIQKELKEVDKLLKLDPKNTELLAQKQKLLSDAIQNTKEKLDTLKAAQSQVNEQFAKGEISEGQYRAFQREIEATEQKLKELEKTAGTAKKSLDEIGDSMKSTGEKMSKVGGTLTKTVTAPITAIGALALKAGIDFESGMSRVEAISGATGESLDKLKGQAKQLGESTVFSASQAAEGMEYLALAGWGVDEIYSAMPAMLNLAAAGALDLGRAADITSDTMSAFGLSATDAAHAADVFAYAQANANTSVNQMGEAMNYLAPTANSLGWTLEESSAIIMKLADSGLKGSMATQAFGTSLVRLAAPTPKATKLIKDLGMEFFNAEGQMKSMPEVLAEMEKGLEGMSDQQKAATMDVLVGKNAFKQWQILLDTGSDSLAELTQNLIESDGSAQKMADTMTDNAKGGLIELKSALEGLAIQLSEIMIPIFNQVVDALKGTVSWFAGLDEGTKKTILVIASLAAAIGPVLIVVGKVITSIGILIKAFAAVKAVIIAAGGVMTLLTGPVGIVIALVAALAAAAFLIIKNWESISKFFSDLWKGIVDVTVSMWESIKSFFVETWEWLKSFFMEWGPLILSIIAPMLGIPLLIYQHWDEIKTFMTQVWDAVVSYLTGVWDNIKTKAVDAFQQMVDLVKPIIEGFEKFFQGIWDVIKNIFAGALLLIIDLVTGDFTKLKEDAEGIWNNLKDAFARIWQGIKEIFSSTLDAIKTVISTTWDKIKNGVSTAWNTIKSVVTTLITAILTWIKTQWNNLLTFFLELPSKLYNIGTDMFNRMRDGVTSTVTGVKDAIVTGITTAIDWIKNLPSTMIDLGKDMIQGLINGIGSMIGKVKDKVKEVADSVTGGIRNLLGINSPSRVLKEIGEWTGEGFAIGIGESVDQVKRQTAEMAASALPDKPSTMPTKTSNNISFEGFMSGAIFNVRSENDIQAIARELFNLQQQALRGAGVR